MPPARWPSSSGLPAACSATANTCGRIRPWLARFSLVSAVGGIIGAVLLTKTSDALFGKMVPFLILFATVLFVAQDAFRRFAKKKPAGSGGPGALWGAMVFQFLVAVYGGYFGAGIGILMLASLGFLGMTQIHEMNALKTVLGSLINAVATVWFIWAGLIDWTKAGIMTAGALVGYYLAAHYSQRISQQPGATIDLGHRLRNFRRNVLQAICEIGVPVQWWGHVIELE